MLRGTSEQCCSHTLEKGRAASRREEEPNRRYPVPAQVGNPRHGLPQPPLYLQLTSTEQREEGPTWSADLAVPDQGHESKPHVGPRAYFLRKEKNKISERKSRQVPESQHGCSREERAWSWIFWHFPNPVSPALARPYLEMEASLPQLCPGAGTQNAEGLGTGVCGPENMEAPFSDLFAPWVAPALPYCATAPGLREGHPSSVWEPTQAPGSPPRADVEQIPRGRGTDSITKAYSSCRSPQKARQNFFSPTLSRLIAR